MRSENTAPGGSAATECFKSAAWLRSHWTLQKLYTPAVSEASKLATFIDTKSLGNQKSYKNVQQISKRGFCALGDGTQKSPNKCVLRIGCWDVFLFGRDFFETLFTGETFLRLCWNFFNDFETFVRLFRGVLSRVRLFWDFFETFPGGVFPRETCLIFFWDFSVITRLCWDFCWDLLNMFKFVDMF